MTEPSGNPGRDLIRWTFTTDPYKRAEVEGYLNDLGLDVLVRGESLFIVTWEEPDHDLDEVIEELWALNGSPFEVTEEEFHRTSLLTLHHAEDDPGHVADRPAA
jgi:hypothetical protein